MRLICFGDSWTTGHGVETDKQFKETANPPDFIKCETLENCIKIL